MVPCPDLGAPPGTLQSPIGAEPAHARFLHPVNLFQALGMVVGQAADWILVNQDQFTGLYAFHNWRELIEEETQSC